MTDHSGDILMMLGLLLMAAALCLAGFNVFSDSHAGSESDEAAATLAALIPESGTAVLSTGDTGFDSTEAADDGDFEMFSKGEELPMYVLYPEMEMPIQVVDGKEYIAMLSIPALELELPVMSEWSYPNLRSSPCRYTGSAYLNNLVIAAHNYNRHFGRLKTLSAGDQVILTDMDGNVFTYEVVLMETLMPRDVTELTESEWDLTLFTCTVGGASRVTIRCEKVK